MFQLDEDTIITSNLTCYAQWNVKPEDDESDSSELISDESYLMDEP